MERRIKTVGTGLGIAFVIALLITIVVTLLLYIELLGVAGATRILYGGFITVLFFISFTTARQIGSRGLFVGLAIAGILIILSMMYRLIGVESSLNLAFLIRSGITLLVSTTGAVFGVNTVK